MSQDTTLAPMSVLQGLTSHEIRAINLIADARTNIKTNPEASWNGGGGGLAPHRIGTYGEFAVAHFLNICPIVGVHPFGDDGNDLYLWDRRSVSVKTRTRRGWDFALKNANTREFKDVNILCWFVGDTKDEGPNDTITIEIVGWLPKSEAVPLATATDFGHGRRLVVPWGAFRDPCELLKLSYRRTKNGGVA